MIPAILDWPCKICGVLNRYHEVFAIKGDDGVFYYQRQAQLYDTPKLVPSREGHYAYPPCNNLEYLEYLYDKRTYS